ncbi:MAG: radical SAM protein [bacterium]|nr:radical SAM protein [bacterium]
MNILIANLPGVQVQQDGSIRHFAKAGSRWPMTIGNTKSVDYYAFPFWLATATALLKKSTEHRVKGFDAVVNDCTDQDFFAEAEAFKPDLLVAELTTISIDSDMALLLKIQETLGAKLVLTGNYPTVAFEALFQQFPSIDYIIRGEYEYPLLELVEAWGQTDAQKQIAGLCIGSPQGPHISDPRKMAIDSFRQLPWPDREDFPANLYMDFSIYAPCISVVATRGCPAGCIFCQERHILYNSPMFRTRDPEDVVDEILWIKERYKARQIYFDDMTLVANNKFVKKLCQAMIDRQVNLPWTCMGDVMFVKEDTIELMAKAGCIGMKFGVESANPEILQFIDKPLKLESAKRKVQLCKDLGIRTHATFMIGLPGETEETIEQTFNFMVEINTFTAQIAKAVPFPGTPFYRWAQEEGLLKNSNLSDLDGMGETVISYPGLSPERFGFWYQKFSKRIARQKLLNFLGQPVSSLSIIMEFLRHKGLVRTLGSIFTVVRRVV